MNYPTPEDEEKFVVYSRQERIDGDVFSSSSYIILPDGSYKTDAWRKVGLNSDPNYNSKPEPTHYSAKKFNAYSHPGYNGYMNTDPAWLYFATKTHAPHSIEYKTHEATQIINNENASNESYTSHSSSAEIVKPSITKYIPTTTTEQTEPSTEKEPETYEITVADNEIVTTETYYVI